MHGAVNVLDTMGCLLLSYVILPIREFQVAAVGSGVVGFAISFCSLWFLSSTTPTTYSLVGSLNKIPLAVIGLLTFQAKPTIKNTMSVGIGGKATPCTPLPHIPLPLQTHKQLHTFTPFCPPAHTRTDATNESRTHAGGQIHTANLGVLTANHARTHTDRHTHTHARTHTDRHTHMHD
jgi:hypothetical protein